MAASVAEVSAAGGKAKALETLLGGKADKFNVQAALSALRGIEETYRQPSTHFKDHLWARHFSKKNDLENGRAHYEQGSILRTANEPFYNETLNRRIDQRISILSPHKKTAS